MPKYRCRFGRSSRYVWENAAAKAQEEGHNCDEDCMVRGSLSVAQKAVVPTGMVADAGH